MLSKILHSLRKMKCFRPLSLFQVELTGYCNINCSMCARSYGLKRPIGHMDLALFKEIVDQSKHYKMPIGWFHHFGETLMYPKLREALSYFKNKGFGTGAVSTNAILLDKENIEILLDNAKYILCCIDTMEQAAYKKIRCNDKFGTVRSNIQQLIAERDKRGIDCNIVIQFLRTQYNRNEDIGGAMDYFGCHSNLKFIEKATVRHPRTADATVYKSANVLANKTKCHNISNQLCVLWSGECVPCCWDANGEQVIGDLKKQNLIEVWQGAQHKRMQRLLRKGLFNKLPLCKKCFGPCETDANIIKEILDKYPNCVIEQTNIYVEEWLSSRYRVILAPADKSMYRLLKQSRLAEVSPIAVCDVDCKDFHWQLSGIPIISDEMIVDLRPDVVFIFSPTSNPEVYFKLRHLKKHGIKVITLGGFLD